MEALTAAAEDWTARVEREVIRRVAAYARRGFVGELWVRVARDGSVDVSDDVLSPDGESRVGTIEVSPLAALHYLERAQELAV